VLGLLIGLLLAFGLEYLQSDVLRSSEDVERHVGVVVLGAIPIMGSGDGESTGGGKSRRFALFKGR
jgi:capsular polysaccharide biosynthesis protein